jgi:gliding-associated putative ABC transporter substrate-binding component GldG
MDLRRRLLAHTWAQLGLVLLIVILANTWSARSFFRVDLTQDRVYTLDLTTRALLAQLEKRLLVKVYFTRGLEAPYNNHEQILVDKLEDLRAYSKGMMDIQVTDPTFVKELMEEAGRFGITPIQYRYRSSSVTEMKEVYMGVALVYGDRQEVIPAVTDTNGLEYLLARAIKRLLSDEPPPVVGWTVANDEPSLLTGTGPLERIRNAITEEYQLVGVELGGVDGVPEEVDALFVVGPQKPFSDRAQYQLDQFLMRGGSLAVFVTNTRPDLRSLRPQAVLHGLDALMGHYGVQINRDVVVDRQRNGMMSFPVLQGRQVVQVPVNYPLIPRATKLHPDSAVTRGLESMLFPFASSLTLADPMPTDVVTEVLAASSEAGGRIRGVRTIDPAAYKMVAPGEERGSWPLVVTASGTFRSAFADKPIPPPAQAPPGFEDDASARLRESAPARLVVSGSADFVANNVAFMLNLTDWMAQDTSLIDIRSKQVRTPVLEPLETAEDRAWRAFNLLAGSAAMLLLGLGRAARAALVARRSAA